MAFVQTQTLEYCEHKEEIDTLARALKSLQRHDVNSAIEVLVARHAHLIAGQSPVLKDYNPRLAMRT
jgi:hypothetical protein